ncbi:MAG TPA: ATP-binding protein [Bryobacteraceae bacterium]|jgi:heavy metal sensor kinase
MMNVRSLRFRLAVWYFSTVAAICLLAGGGYWFTIQRALGHALDQGLRFRMMGLHQFIEEMDPTGIGEIATKLSETSELAELYEVFDENGTLIVQSTGLERHHVRNHPPPNLGSEMRFESGGTHDFELRLAWQQVNVGGRTLILGVADPQRKYEGVLHALNSILLLSAPLIIGLATISGVWLGRRALEPVKRIADDARSITETNLSARLAVPDSQDELQQLSETLNEMLDRIEQSFTRTKQFTADASHELRAPMTLIHTAAQFSLRKERSREELVDSMRKILRESKRTSALINDLLVLARGDSGRDTVELKSIDVVPLLRDLSEQAAGVAAAKDLRLTLHLPIQPLTVRGEEAKLQQLLLILLDNAIKYTPSGGSVEIAGTEDDKNVSIIFTDTGVGIAADDLPRIFERFWRADKVRSRDAGGTGLGLAIAKQIAAEHGAALNVESEAGRGSVFTLRFPKSDG